MCLSLAAYISARDTLPIGTVQHVFVDVTLNCTANYDGFQRRCVRARNPKYITVVLVRRGLLSTIPLDYGDGSNVGLTLRNAHFKVGATSRRT